MGKLLHLLLGAALVITRGVEAADCVSVALQVIPNCAQSCFINGAPSIGCGGTDFVCQCEQEAKLYAAVEGCVSSGCPSASYQAVIDGASSVCNCATTGLAGGVGSMSVPPVSGIGGTTTGTSAATSPATTAPATTTTKAGVTSQPTITPAPGLSTSAGNSPPSSTFSPYATASVVHAGSARSSMLDIRLLGCIAAAVALGLASV